MATYDEVLGRIEKEREEIRRIPEALNVRDSDSEIKNLRSRQHDILAYKDKVTEVVSQTTDAEKAKTLKEAYDALQALVEKRLGCLQKMYQIAQLEDNCSSLSQIFDLRASFLVHPNDLDAESHTKPEKNLSGFIAQTSQDCIFGVHDNWRWIITLLKCVEVHLQNGAAYSEFFHEVQESEPWMLDDLLQILRFFETRVVSGDENEAKKLAAELEKIHLTLRQWEAKTTRLWETATKLVPVPLRTKRNEEPYPARALCDYSSKEVSVRENEDIVLLDSSLPKLWKIKNGRGQEGQVPAPVVLIPGPDGDAIKAAVKLRLQLLINWTNVLKLIGKRLVYFMLIIFKAGYTPDEIAALKSMDDLEKENLLQMLNFIEEVFNRYWSDHDGYTSVQERILVLRMILEGQAEGDVTNEELYKQLLLLISTLFQASTHYKHTLDDWEKFKVVLEASRSPELMLIVDKWEQLKFVTKEYFSKFWKTTLPLDGLEDLVDGGGLTGNERLLDERTVVIPDEVLDEPVTKAESKPLHYEQVVVTEGEELEEFDTEGNRLGSAEDYEGGDYGVAREKKTAETEQYSQAEMEENKTFIIQSVVNPADKKEISLQEAIMLGVIRPDEGVYVDTTTGKTIPIPEAMGNGSIKVTLSKMKRTKEKTSSMGIITVKTIREATRPYTILSVKDTKTDEELTPDEAAKRGILKEGQGLYTDLKAGKKMLITEAADAGLIKVEYFGEQPEAEVVSTTYAVRAVVDRKHKKTVTFNEAIKRGIIEKDTGNYVDSETGEKMYVGDAIVRGFLKARIVEDPSALNIDPENTILISKTQKIRERLLKPLKIISAFRMAAKK